jgi:hypothetical protein
MDRATKIKLLKAIKEGAIPPESLEPPKTFVFMENHRKKGYYTKEGVEYSSRQYNSFCKKIEDKNRKLRAYSPDLPLDEVITVVFVEGLTIL